MKNFLKNLFGLSIKSKILKILNEKINASQKHFDDSIYFIKQSRKASNKTVFENFSAELTRIQNDYKNAVEREEKEVINSILSNFNIK